MLDIVFYDDIKRKVLAPALQNAHEHHVPEKKKTQTGQPSNQLLSYKEESERSERAQQSRVKQAGWSKEMSERCVRMSDRCERMSEWCKRTSKWTSKWPSTYIWVFWLI